MMSSEIEGFDEAYVFYGIVEEGKNKLYVAFDYEDSAFPPMLWNKKEEVPLLPGEKAVKVYLVVEDD